MLDDKQQVWLIWVPLVEVSEWEEGEVFKVSEKSVVELKAYWQLHTNSAPCPSAPQVLEGEAAANLLTSGLPQVRENVLFFMINSQMHLILVE